MNILLLTGSPVLDEKLYKEYDMSAVICSVETMLVSDHHIIMIEHPSIVPLVKNIANDIGKSTNIKITDEIFANKVKIDGTIIIGGGWDVLSVFGWRYILTGLDIPERIFPIPTTTGAARMIFNEWPELGKELREELKTETSYKSLTGKILNKIICSTDR